MKSYIVKIQAAVSRPGARRAGAPPRRLCFPTGRSRLRFVAPERAPRQARGLAPGAGNTCSPGTSLPRSYRGGDIQRCRHPAGARAPSQVSGKHEISLRNDFHPQDQLRQSGLRLGPPTPWPPRPTGARGPGASGGLSVPICQGHRARRPARVRPRSNETAREGPVLLLARSARGARQGSRSCCSALRFSPRTPFPLGPRGGPAGESWSRGSAPARSRRGGRAPGTERSARCGGDGPRGAQRRPRQHWDPPLTPLRPRRKLTLEDPSARRPAQTRPPGRRPPSPLPEGSRFRPGGHSAPCCPEARSRGPVRPPLPSVTCSSCILSRSYAKARLWTFVFRSLAPVGDAGNVWEQALKCAPYTHSTQVAPSARGQPRPAPSAQRPAPSAPRPRPGGSSREKLDFAAPFTDLVDAAIFSFHMNSARDLDLF